ncbi:MAG: hypothetical protein NVS3B26_25650 [Mycobacteriales bacterium]
MGRGCSPVRASQLRPFGPGPNLTPPGEVPLSARGTVQTVGDAPDGDRLTVRHMDADAKSVVEREQLLLQPAVRRDGVRLLSLLYPDFFEYGASGRVWDRSSVAATTVDSTEPIEARNDQARRLGPDAFLVTYTSDDAGRVALRSSTWMRHQDEWLLLFHQGTLIAGV